MIDLEPMKHEMMYKDDYDIINDILDTRDSVYHEINGADEYIDKAMMHKSRDRQAADNMVALSAQELQHAGVLQGNIDRMMTKVKETNPNTYAILSKAVSRDKPTQARMIAQVKEKHEQYKK